MESEITLPHDQYHELLQTFIHQAPISIAMFDLKMNYMAVSGRWVDKYGQGRKELIGLSHYDVMPDLPDEWKHANEECLAGASIINREYYWTKANMTPVWQRRSMQPWVDKLGVIGGIIVTIDDITEQKLDEENNKLRITQLAQAFMSTVEVTVALMALRDPYTAGHEKRVAEIAANIGIEMGLRPPQIEALRVMGRLHDIGKIVLPAEILAKPGRITPTEYALIKEHSQIGYEVLKSVTFPWPVAEVTWQHHERLDGSGYPRRLKGDEILLEARIISVADTIEAMASHRPYRPGHGINSALEEISRGSGTLYDPIVSKACLRLFREKDYVLPM